MSLSNFLFDINDYLVFGRETAGVPETIHESVDSRVNIPIATHARSMNVVTVAAMALWEGLRQTKDFPE